VGRLLTFRCHAVGRRTTFIGKLLRGMKIFPGGVILNFFE
jgi:hypothetical protein